MPGPIIAPETGIIERQKLTPLYHVVLLDDDDHTYDYVVEMLTKIFLLPARSSLRSRRGSGYHRPHHRDDLRTGAGRVWTRPDPWLRRRSAHAQVERLDEGHRRAGRAGPIAVYLRGLSGFAAATQYPSRVRTERPGFITFTMM